MRVTELVMQVMPAMKQITLEYAYLAWLAIALCVLTILHMQILLEKLVISHGACTCNQYDLSAHSAAEYAQLFMISWFFMTLYTQEMKITSESNDQKITIFISKH